MPRADRSRTAIDAAGTNDLILVAPGIYNEFVIMWKPVQLQGWGAGSTDHQRRQGHRRRAAASLARQGGVAGHGQCRSILLPGQERCFGGIEPVTFFTEEGAGVLVLARGNGNTRFDAGRNRGARIDGFTIRGADQGGGIVVNGYADYLEISNNVLNQQQRLLRRRLPSRPPAAQLAGQRPSAWMRITTTSASTIT